MYLLATLAEVGVPRKDVVITAIGAGAALAGFVLVFVGILISSYQTLLGRASEDTLTRFKRTAWLAFALFALGLVSVALGTAWLLDSSTWLYYAILLAFFAELGGLLVVALYATWRVLLR